MEISNAIIIDSYFIDIYYIIHCQNIGNIF